MKYFIKEEIRKNRLEAYDENDNLVGEALMSPFMSSEIFDQPRLNIYINILVNKIEDKIEVKDSLLHELIIRGNNVAKKEKEKNENLEVKFYHCCFADDKENIQYYSSKDGFQQDEGMYIFKLLIEEDEKNLTPIEGIEFVDLVLDDEKVMKELIKKQGEIFTSGYTMVDLNRMKQEDRYFCISAKHNGKLVGNVVVIIKESEDNNVYGWIDDLFVSKEYRRLGIGKYLLLAAINKMRCLQIKESMLEVWSSNEKAMAMYQSVGYEFYKETEVAIGMFL